MRAGVFDDLGTMWMKLEFGMRKSE